MNIFRMTEVFNTDSFMVSSNDSEIVMTPEKEIAAPQKLKLPGLYYFTNTKTSFPNSVWEGDFLHSYSEALPMIFMISCVMG